MQNKSAPEEFDVVIVGRGPVGATLANLLGLCGVRTLVLEREARTYHLRCAHLQAAPISLAARPASAT
jgi:3-(3-hydroxy-phenyl)propionate hydroxylase